MYCNLCSLFIYASQQKHCIWFSSLICCLVVFNYFLVFQGMEEFGKIVFRDILFKFVNIIYIFAFVKTKNDVIVYLFGMSFFSLIYNISYWIAIDKYIDMPVLKDLHPARHVKAVASLFVPTIAIQVYTVLDKTMIGIITQNPFESWLTMEQQLKNFENWYLNYCNFTEPCDDSKNWISLWERRH